MKQIARLAVLALTLVVLCTPTEALASPASIARGDAVELGTDLRAVRSYMAAYPDRIRIRNGQYEGFYTVSWIRFSPRTKGMRIRLYKSNPARTASCFVLVHKDPNGVVDGWAVYRSATDRVSSGSGAGPRSCQL